MPGREPAPLGSSIPKSPSENFRWAGPAEIFRRAQGKSPPSRFLRQGNGNRDRVGWEQDRHSGNQAGQRLRRPRRQTSYCSSMHRPAFRRAEPTSDLNRRGHFPKDQRLAQARVGKISNGMTESVKSAAAAASPKPGISWWRCSAGPLTALICLSVVDAAGDYLPVVGPSSLRFKKRAPESIVAIAPVAPVRIPANSVVEPESAEDPLLSLITPLEPAEWTRSHGGTEGPVKMVTAPMHIPSLIDPTGQSAITPDQNEAPVTAEMLVELFRPSVGTNGGGSAVIISTPVTLPVPKAPASSSATYTVQ